MSVHWLLATVPEAQDKIKLHRAANFGRTQAFKPLV